jgi:hypothetical protein
MLLKAVIVTDHLLLIVNRRVVNMAVFKYASMLVSSSLSCAGTGAPNEAPATVYCAGIGWGTSMPPM